MSGGRFDYKDSALKNEIFGWGDKPSNVFEDREISELTWDLLDLIHEFDWYSSGDTGKEDYLKAKDKFENKWLGNRGVRVKTIIDEAVRDLRAELYETFGFRDNPPVTLDDLKQLISSAGREKTEERIYESE